MALVLQSLTRGEQLGFSGSGIGSVRFRYGYVTTDTAAVVETAGYFNLAAALLNPGDIIFAVMATGGTPVLKNYVVATNSGTVVAIALQTVTAG